jgi:DNA-directed RNA polymerase II subunit RPB11
MEKRSVKRSLSPVLDEHAENKDDHADTVPGMAHTSDFVIKKEDHTIGNLISEHLKKHQNVLMAGYKSWTTSLLFSPWTLTRYAVAHPNVPELFIRIQTDGTITPRDAFNDVCKKLLRDLSILSQEFTREWELRRMVAAGEQSGQNGQR